MRLNRLCSLALMTAVTLALPSAFAQTAGQDMKNAGSDTKNATKSAGHGISKGTKTGYRKTKHGTKKAYHKVDGSPNTK